MVIKILVLAVYFIAVLGLGFLTRSRLKDSPTKYFLANRKLGTFVLIGTMAATNFSAFTVFGASGAGYRDGIAFFPIMAFGTGFMALTFWLIGRKAWKIGKENNLVTPPELVGKIYNNQLLTVLFALVMIIFTIPYLAIQPMVGGSVLKTLLGIPEIWGAFLVTGIILLYTLRGGLKAVAWTDVFQGLLMVGLMVVALIMVASHHNGLANGFSQVQESNSELFSRPGGTGKYLPAMWFSWMMLWFFCDPMFPQLFQRFFAARSEKSLGLTTILYPLICTVVFFIPISIGILGRLHFPDLVGTESDNIMSLLMTEIGGDFMGTLVLAAGLAALMSTMDSQLLTLSSIFTKDVVPLFIKRNTQVIPETRSGIPGRLFVVGLAIAGLIIALNPVGTIVDMAVKQAFTGLAVLFPTVFFGLYLENPRPASAITSILVGEILLVLYAIPALSLPAFGFLPAVPIIAATIFSYLIVHLVTGRVVWPKISRRNLLFAGAFILVFVLAMDFWRWRNVGPVFLGWPVWAWYFVVLSAIQTILMFFWIKPRKNNDVNGNV